MEPREIGAEALPERLRFIKPDERHSHFAVSDCDEGTYVKGHGILILEWNHRPETDFQLDGCFKKIEFELPGGYWQVYALEAGVRFHQEDLVELSRDKQQTAVLRNYLLSTADLLFDYKLPEDAQTAAELEEALSKCGSEMEKQSMALVVEVPIDGSSTEFFFVEAIDIQKQQDGNEFARQPVLVIKAFGSPGWTAFDYPSERPRTTEVPRKDSSVTPQIVQAGMTSHATKAKVKILKMQDPLY